ncbi:hypothetical protein CANINC_000627 [Pichia inconspicua]|uniref:EamA domain-containing protein n=1 Tax=Pichia inconspicua TaxID=52247 RepID=A0A4T0X5G7_9ASCO|nr:hypothetical protein CANINC_000627 [[Candida] inconspicua]
MSEVRSPKLIKTPTFLVTSPRFQDLFLLSPQLSTHNEETIPTDQVYNEVVDLIITEEKIAWKAGLLIVVVSLICWLSALQIMNIIMKETEYDHPLFAAYLNGSFFLLFGIKQIFKDIRKYWKSRNSIQSNEQSPLLVEPELFDKLNTPKIRLSQKEIIKVSLWSAFFYFANCYLGSAALKYTSASNQTIFATTSAIWSLIIGIIFKIEKFTIGKVISVMCSIIGIFMITFRDSIHFSTISTENFGDLIAIIGACSYSCFLIVLRLKLGQQTDSKNDSLLYGYMGLSTLVLGFPILLIYNYLNWEPLVLPDNKTLLWMFLLSSILGATSDYLASKASVITSPLIVSLSLSVGIPINIMFDTFMYGNLNLSLSYFIGLSLILASFVFVNISDEQEIIEHAIEEAFEEAIRHDENIIEVLSPRGESIDNNDLIPEISISENLATPRLIVTGGENHKYFFRELKD